ncbi:MAG: aspartate aminotransferase family protein [Eggerthellaceae bacterium]|jgi:4-aminobutyrate aminotransferase|nr:aspartate aminotransferase family protein [Eggerthellaceae bacterium]
MTKANNERSRALVEVESAYMAPTARIPYYDMVVDHGCGAKIYDVDGNEYIDLISSASATNVGHCHPRVVKAVCDQAQKLLLYSPAYMYQEPEIKLVEKLCQIAPGDTPKKAVFGTSGSDANDAVMKFARAYTGRPYMITFQGSYHGSTYGSMSLSGLSLNMVRKMGPLVPGIYHIPYPDSFHQGVDHLSEEEQVEYFMRPLLDMTSMYLPPDEVACVLMEPIAGDMGIIPAPPAYMRALYAWCQEHGILFAVDEINQGMGRSGTWWSIEHYGIEPDLMSVGKSIASGLPLSAIVGKADIMDALSFPAHIFTTSGNPVCCAAALATIGVIEDEHLLERGTELGEYARARFQKMVDEHPIAAAVHGSGLNLGVDIMEPGTRTKSAKMALKIVYRAFELGVVIITYADSVLRFQPPLVIEHDELDRALDVIDQCIGEVERGEVPDDLVPAGKGW